MEIVKCILEILEKIAIIGGVIIALVSLCADHRRRKKQATFEFYHSIYKDFIEPLNKEKEKFSKGQIIDIKKDKELYNQIEAYLSCMERFAVGINEGIYDYDVFRRTVGANFTKEWYGRFEEIVRQIKRDFNNDNLYVELKCLVLRLDGFTKIKRRKN